MKQLWPYLVLIPLLFICFLFKKEPIQSFEHVRPKVPAPLTAHPWIAMQQLGEVVPEMVRDMQLVEEFCLAQKEDMTPILMQTLLALQAEVPFHFPHQLYNVLCITETPKKKHFPYQVYKRVYFGDTQLGMPMYFDVRVFDTTASQAEKIVQWHFQSINGQFQPFQEGFFGCGTYHDEDLTHGFAPSRAVYLVPHFERGRLYVLFADVPIEYADQLKQLVSSHSFLGE